MSGRSMSEFKYKRIIIIGNGGAGKSTLARALGERLGLPVVHLDKLWWLPDWVTRSQAEFDALLAAELEKPEWIIEGNYIRTLALRLSFADLCVFLYYPPELCLESAYARVRTYEGKTRPDMTDGCTERVDAEFEEWIKSFDKNVRPQILEISERAGVRGVTFCSREQAAAWLAQI